MDSPTERNGMSERYDILKPLQNFGDEDADRDIVQLIRDAAHEITQLRKQRDAAVEALRQVCVDLRYYDHRDTGQKVNRAPHLTNTLDIAKAAIAAAGEKA